VSAQREWFAARGIDVAVVSFATPERLKPYQEIKQWPFPIYADPDRKVYAAFALGRLSWWRILRPRVVWKYLKLVWQGRKIQRSHGADVFQGGGDFLVTPTGDLLYEFRSDDPADRPTVAELKNVVSRDLKGSDQH
jgi:hypothetical protein